MIEMMQGSREREVCSDYVFCICYCGIADAA